MCGILAQITDHPPVDRNHFSTRLNAQRHRGPDGQRTWFSPNGRVALGHNLLSLTGSKNVRQPFLNEDDKIIASVNGEFYGYETIRKQLEQRGHHFHSDSDSEIVLHLYEEYGEQCLEHLQGEFALIIWDSNRETLFAARDRFGIKPLHYRTDSNGIIIASEAKTILHKSGPARWNNDALSRVLTHQYLAPDESLFDGIPQLPPAHFLSYKNGQLKLTRYWEPKVEKTEASPEELLSLLEKSVIDRIHPEAVFSLSGGIDSSAVAKIASRHLGQKVTAFSVSFDEQAYDELSLVQQSADDLGAKINPVNVTRSDLLNILPEAVKMTEGLAINGQLVGKFLLNRAIQESGHRVVISGEGADEALLGYAHLQTDHHPNHACQHPLQAGIMLPDSTNQITTPLPNWLKSWPTFFKAKLNFCRQFSSLIHTDWERERSESETTLQTFDTIKRLGFHLPDADAPHQSAWLWTRLALANSILKTLGDGTEMSHGIEGRVPFLDHHFFEHAWNHPTHRKLSDTQTKIIFRESTRSLLPPTISNRAKHPFLAPPLLGDSSLASQIRDLLGDSQFRNLSIFNQDAVITWFDQLSRASNKEKQSADPILHTLLSLSFLQNSYQLTL